MKVLRAADLFCGAGGATTGAVRAAAALGVQLEMLAVNHWQIAIDTHSLNHPSVRHLCESVERINPRDAVPGGRLHLLIAAPECTNHSRARGGRPVNDQSRATAWHILKWCQELYIDNVLIENVEEFREWGPLGANGKPLKSRKGETYRAFLEALRSLGYTVEDRVLNAADYGDPTTRRRLFIMARRGNRPIVWPAPTHSKTGGRTLFGKTEKWRPARDVIDWSVPSQSIFTRKRPLSPKTLARIFAGLERFGGKELEPFLVVLRRNGAGRSLDRPMPTIAAQGQHVALCEPFIVPNNENNQPKSLDEPVPTVTGGNRLLLCEPFVLGQHGGATARKVGDPLPTITTDGAISLIEPFLIPHYGEREGQTPRSHSVDEPMPTIPASNKFELVQPFIVPPRGFSDGPVDSVDRPLRTIVAASGHTFALVEPFISSYYGTKNISPVSAPLPTITTKDRFALVLPVVDGRALDIRLRMLKPHELARAMSFGDDYQFAGNQGDQVKQIGNAWPCRLGQALIQSLIEGYAGARHKPRRLEVVA